MNFKNYVIAVLLGTLVMFSSCADKKYETIINGGNANMQTHYEKIGAKEWGWNAKAARYEFMLEVDYIDEVTVDDEVVLVSLVLNEDGHRVMKTLPYEIEYKDANNGEVYTRRFSYDISDFSLALYIEDNDMSQGHVITNDYEYKIVVINNLDI